MNNPMQVIQLLKGKTSPKEIVMNMLGVNNNPMMKNLIEMAEKGDTKGVENVAKNFFSERGKDFNQEYDKFMSNFR